MTHTHTLADPRVETAISRMFELSARDETAQAQLPPGALESMAPQELADAAAGIYMPISADGGKLLYNLVRAIRPATVVEFGMSYGISTLHLAAAVRDNGTGRVITTELSKEKIAAARGTFAETGLDDLITVLEGDARETLADLDGPLELVLLDGWKDLCLPVLRMLEPRLRPGALVVADDIDQFEGPMRPYLDYVRDSANGYQNVSFPIEDGMEISCRL
ncbi:O-methyltransferase [Streptomyces malaysiensis]|uniref:Methyltransferase n=1 Tax=Streptomyces autolyticus TaxID=75293 RepID=A0ABM6HHJ6_9ACTN|nr:class I SAM-dependent methyltransferase [Streptomyces autolyticus]AQA13495.1 methyltransferase [Streptomyces autolyticus]